MSPVVEITSLDAPELDVYARLTEAQLLNRFEPAKGMFIAESPKVIHRALDAGCRPVSLLMERKDIDGSAREILARCPEIPVYTADESVLCQLTGYHLTRGVLCAMRRPALPTLEAVCENARRVVILENVQNPTNVGAIFRSAAALGMDAVLLLSLIHICARLVPYHAVGTAGGMLLALPLLAGTGKERRRVLVAFAPEGLENGRYQGLTGGAI